MTGYRYELRRGEKVIATGYLNHEQPPAVGDRLTIGTHSGLVRSIQPVLGERELRLVVQLIQDDFPALACDETVQ